MYDVAMLVFAAIAAIGAVLAVLPLLGFDLRIRGRQNATLGQSVSRPRKRVWLALTLAVTSLGLSAGAFYYFFRPRVVEKTVEKAVSVPCPDQKSPEVPLKQRSQVESKPITVPKVSTPSSQNCPNGICIGGENSGTATVNNFMPPQRLLTADQHKNLADLLRQTGTFSLVIRHAEHNFEAQTYADSIGAAIKEAGWKVDDNPALLFETRQGEGVKILVRDINHPPLGAVALQTALKQIGLNADGASIPVVPEKEMWLYIGVNR